MLPFRDDVPSRIFPLVTISLILLNCAVFVWEWTLPPERLQEALYLNGLVPARLEGLGQAPAATLAVTLRTGVTSIFLHGGWLHLLGNMLYLWVFGDNVEDRMGHLRFLAFYLLCGLTAGMVHSLLTVQSEIPAIGASGAVAGVLGAYLIRFPFARIYVIIPLFFFWPVVALPALLVLGSWFFLQLAYGWAAIAQSAQTVGGVAWWAHVGGFLAGMLLLGLFERRRPALATT